MNRWLGRAMWLVVLSATLAAQTPQAPAAPTRASILRGEYGRYRANNDLLYYHLDIRVDPAQEAGQRQEHHPLQDAATDTRIQIDLYANLNVDKILLGRRDAEVRARAERGLHRFSVDAPEGPRVRDRLLLLRAHRSSRAASAASCSRRTRRAGSGSSRPARARARACGGRARTSGATKSRAWTSASRCRARSRRTRRTAASSARRISATAITRWDWHVSYPINSYNVSINATDYVQFARQARRLDARLLRDAGESRQGQGPVRAGQADDRGLQALLRRVPVREGRLQADRGAVHRHGAPERGDLRQRLRERLRRARLDGRRHQPEVRLHHHSRERPRVVRQRRVGRRRLRHVDSGRLVHLPRGPVRRADVRLRRCAEVRERLQDEGPEPDADRHATRHPPDAARNDKYFKGALFLNTLRSVVNDDKKWWAIAARSVRHVQVPATS